MIEDYKTVAAELLARMSLPKAQLARTHHLARSQQVVINRATNCTIYVCPGLPPRGARDDAPPSHDQLEADQ